MNPDLTGTDSLPRYSSGASFGHAPHGKQAFHRPRTSLGIAGHWLHLAAVLSPLVIGEIIQDPNQKWRAIRLTSAGMAVASEALWTHKLLKERAQHEEHQV